MLMIELVANTMLVAILLAGLVIGGTRGLERFVAATHARLAQIESRRLDDELPTITD